MPCFRLILLTSFFLFCHLALQAQQQAPAKQASIQKLFDEKNSWNSSAGFVNDICTTQDGKLWVANNIHLISWDGNNKVLYSNNQENEFYLNGDKIHKIFELRNGDLILYTQLDGLQLERLPKGKTKSSLITQAGKTSSSKSYLADVIQTQEKEIFAVFNEGKKAGVYQLKENILSPIHLFEFNKDIHQSSIKLARHEGSTWLAIKGEGVWRMQDGVQQQVMDFKNLPAGDELNPILFFEDSKQRLWLGLDATEQNVFLWNGDSFKLFNTPLRAPIEKMESDALGQVIFVSGKYPEPLSEAYVLQDTTWLNYTPYLDSVFMKVRSSDDLSRSFFAYTKDNIATINLKPIHIKRHLYQKLKKGKWGNIVMGIDEDKQGDLYFLEETTFNRLDKQTGKTSHLPVIDENGNELSFKCGGAVHRDKKGTLWFKVCDEKSAGILINYIPAKGQFNLYRHSEVFRDFDIDVNGQIWIVHHSSKDKLGKVSRFDPDTKKFQSVASELQFAEPRFCYAAADTSVWIGTVKGLVHIDSKNKVYTKKNSALQSDHIIAIHRDTGAWLMLGTYGDGLQFFNPITNETIVYNKEQGLVNNFVCGIIPFENDKYWLSTFDGLSLFDRSEQTFYNFNEKDGLSHREFNRFAYHISADKKVYFGSVNGVNSFYANDLVPQKSKSSVRLSRIKKYYGASDRTELIRTQLDAIKQIRLSPEVTYVELDFYSPSFIQTGPSNIYTRLEEDDDEWLFAPNNSVRFRQLSAGSHRLQIKTQDSSDILKIELFSETPFYKTWWFNLLILSGIIAICALLYRYRINKIKAEEEARIEVNRKFAELELQALQAQLNPHFVFNALGAIQHTIRDNNSEQAEHFLTSFAVLMRLFLESSKNKYITLEEEIELISRYVELERLRYEGGFDFELNISDEVDTNATEIPSMLFQPFVENAINHGLFHKKEKGLLTININETDEILRCIIQDDGVGRKRVAEIQSQSIRKYPSRSTQIVNERLEILRKVEGLNLNIEIEDIENGGTRVIIEIPILDE